jgi:hypothetical protein
MEKLPANAGWQWLKDGFVLFRKQPAEISTLFLAYLFLMFVVGVVPLIGTVLPLILTPVFSMAFMQACADIERGKKVYPNLLLTGFRRPAVVKLLQLGVLYLVAALIAIGASALIDGGTFWQVMSGHSELQQDTMVGTSFPLAMIMSAVVYTPAAMAFWYAAPLIAWQNMGVGKAIFYSFFAVKRAGRAFLAYGLAWMVVGVLLPVLVSTIIGLLFGKTIVVMLILMPLSVVMTVVMYCSFYPTYTTVFGKPEQAVATTTP